LSTWDDAEEAGGAIKISKIGLVNEEQNEKETEKRTPAPKMDPTTA